MLNEVGRPQAQGGAHPSVHLALGGEPCAGGSEPACGVGALLEPAELGGLCGGGRTAAKADGSTCESGGGSSWGRLPRERGLGHWSLIAMLGRWVCN